MSIAKAAPPTLTAEELYYAVQIERALCRLAGIPQADIDLNLPLPPEPPPNPGVERVAAAIADMLMADPEVKRALAQSSNSGGE